MPTAAAARAFFSTSPAPPRPPLHHAGSRTAAAAAVSFPRRSAPTVSLSLSAPASPWAAAANPKYHNAKADAGDEDVDPGELLRRFTREVSRAGVLREAWRRQRHEDARDKRKRKSRDAAWRYRRRRFKGPYPFDEEQEQKERTTDDDGHDNWKLPGGELPSYR
ncbi:uncharacterized protein LOC100844384 [Brachypodium distachyon]|uniref:Uncharacterized protein n=1 Tax=Brachypodium distachyon TaxID=15368 RepID=I1I0L6_BRADI|nr:uncharacterized protein LOC100844384 [Brachypodium distachyon]KQJ94919.1 hypothetical protein BRADI_3g14070v3 [Brachypodium distachyon]|eukprot:XP_003573319.1 uncharacterized protein LOC100844384 [Brachypodium distachyon]